MQHARLRRRSEFAAVQGRGRWWSTPLLTLRALPNALTDSRFGLLVSKRVGGAVVRNRAKRRLREIVKTELVVPGWDMVLIARPRMARASFAEIQSAVRDLLRRGRLLEKGVATGVVDPGEQS
jgi:ribonuclease P protein component